MSSDTVVTRYVPPCCPICGAEARIDPHRIPGQIPCMRCESLLCLDGPNDDNERVIFGRYREIEKLGTNVVGSTKWRVKTWDSNLDRRLVLIKFPEGFPHALKPLYARRNRALAGLRHPHLEEMYRSGLDRGLAALELEWIDGPPLTNRIVKGKPWPVANVLRVVDQLGGALRAIHEMELAHLEISAKAVQVVDGTVPGMDVFMLTGLAESVLLHDHLREPDVFLGIAAYASPEQIRGETADFRSDLYSFGTVLYELLTGCRPFTGRTVEIMKAKLNQPPPSFRTSNRSAHQPAAIEALVLQLLSPDPSLRPRSIASFISNFRDAAKTPVRKAPAWLPWNWARRG